MSARWQVRRTIMTPKATFADFRSQRKKRCVSQSFREDYNNYIMDDSKDATGCATLSSETYTIHSNTHYKAHQAELS